MGSLYDVSERINFFYEILINVISSILLVKYYKSFLIPKGKKHYLSLAGFGVTFFLLRYSIGFFISNSNEFPYMFVRIILMAGAIYLLSSIFFKKDLSKNIFLLCSFLAVQDICLFMSISLGRLFSNVGTLVFNNLWNNGLLSTEQQTITYFNIFIIANSIVHLLLYTTVAIIALKHLANSFIYKNYSLRLSEFFSLILPCLSALAMTNIIRIIIFDPEGSGLNLYDKNPYINLLFFIAAAFLLSTMIVSVKLFQKTVQLHMEEKNAAVMQKQTQQIQEQMRDIDNIYGEIKGMRA